MTQINLLPWREKIRKEQYFRFSIELIVCVVITLIFVSMLHLIFVIRTSYYTNRVGILRQQLGNENVKLKTLKERMKAMDDEVKDLQSILSLKKNSYQAVRQLDELARVIPANVQLKKISRKNSQIILNGNVKSQLQVTLLMKNIAKSTVFKNPTLTKIMGSSKDSEEKDFTLTLDTIPE